MLERQTPNATVKPLLVFNGKKKKETLPLVQPHSQGLYSILPFTQEGEKPWKQGCLR